MRCNSGYQWGGRTAPAGVAARAGRPVAADRARQSGPALRDRLPHLVALAGIAKNFPQQILLGAEMGVKRAIGQARIGHNAGKADRGDAVFPELPGSNVDDALAVRILLALVASHLLLPPLPFHYDRNMVLLS